MIKKSIKILNITEEGRGGGPIFRIQQVASKLYQEGIDTIVLIPSQNSSFLEEKLKSNDVKYIKTSLFRLTKEIKVLLLYCLWFIPEIIKIINIIKKEKIDVVHSNGAWQIKGTIATFFTSAKSVWHLNDSYMFTPVRLIFPLLSRCSNGFVFASNRTKQYYTNLSKVLDKKKNCIIQAPVDLSKFTGAKREKQEVIKITSIGYINPIKGFHTLIEAIAICVQKTNTPFELDIIGKVFPNQNNYQQKLKSLIDKHDLKNVHFKGFQSDIPGVLAGSDIYVCSSLFESSPISIWEALASNTYVVSTDVGDVKTIFNNYNFGSVVNTEDPIQLAHSLLNAIENIDSIKQNGMLGRQIAKENFSLENHSVNQAKFYHSLLE